MLTLPTTSPIPDYINGGRAGNAITVDASGDPKRRTDGLFAAITVKGVDVFAPGMKIYSHRRGNNYGNPQGTSFAGPIVARYRPDT